MVDVQQVTLTTADGESLQAELLAPPDARAIVVITHPHPLMGGDMYTPVPGGFFDALRGSKAAALRFNFRGVGRSSGTHDKGGAERLDVAAAIESAATAVADVPIVLSGWSFGADVSLTVADDRIAGWFLAAPPLSVVDPADMAAGGVDAPKVLAIGANDQFNSPDKAKTTTTAWRNTTIEEIPQADHFFGPQLPVLINQFKTFLDQFLL